MFHWEWIITARWNLVSTKHLRTHLPRWHIVHTSNEWSDSGASFEDSEKIVFFLLARETPGCTGMFSVCCSQASFRPQPARETHAVNCFASTTLGPSCVIAFCGGFECQIHSRVEKASILEFVEGTRKTFAVAKSSLWTSLSFATRPGKEGRQSRAHWILFEKSLSICAVSSLRERKRCTRPTHLPAQRIKQKGPGALSTVWRVWARIIYFTDPPSVLWFVLIWRLMKSKAASLRRAQFTFELRREHVIDDLAHTHMSGKNRYSRISRKDSST